MPTVSVPTLLCTEEAARLGNNPDTGLVIHAYKTL